MADVRGDTLDFLRHQWILWLVCILHTVWGISSLVFGDFPRESLNTALFVQLGGTPVWAPVMLFSSVCATTALCLSTLHAKARLILMTPQQIILYAPAFWILFVAARYYIDGTLPTTNTPYRIWFVGPYGVLLAFGHTCAMIDAHRLYIRTQKRVFLRG